MGIAYIIVELFDEGVTDTVSNISISILGISVKLIARVEVVTSLLLSR